MEETSANPPPCSQQFYLCCLVRLLRALSGETLKISKNEDCIILFWVPVPVLNSSHGAFFFFSFYMNEISFAVTWCTFLWSFKCTLLSRAGSLFPSSFHCRNKDSNQFSSEPCFVFFFPGAKETPANLVFLSIMCFSTLTVLVTFHWTNFSQSLSCIEGPRLDLIRHL